MTNRELKIHNKDLEYRLNKITNMIIQLKEVVYDEPFVPYEIENLIEDAYQCLHLDFTFTPFEISFLRKNGYRIYLRGMQAKKRYNGVSVIVEKNDFKDFIICFEQGKNSTSTEGVDLEDCTGRFFKQSYENFLNERSKNGR